MTVIVNGTERDLREGTTLADVIAVVTEGIDARGVAVARNGEVVLRSAWAATRLARDDRVEVLHAVQGG